MADDKLNPGTHEALTEKAAPPPPADEAETETTTENPDAE